MVGVDGDGVVVDGMGGNLSGIGAVQRGDAVQSLGLTGGPLGLLAECGGAILWAPSHPMRR